VPAGAKGGGRSAPAALPLQQEAGDSTVSHCSQLLLLCRARGGRESYTPFQHPQGWQQKQQAYQGCKSLSV